MKVVKMQHRMRVVDYVLIAVTTAVLTWGALLVGKGSGNEMLIGFLILALGTPVWLDTVGTGLLYRLHLYIHSSIYQLMENKGKLEAIMEEIKKKTGEDVEKAIREGRAEIVVERKEKD